MDSKGPIKSRSARSSVSSVSSISANSRPATDSRRSSVLSNLSLNSYSEAPVEERVHLLNLQNQKNRLRIIKGLQKFKHAKSAVAKQAEYTIHNPDPIAKKLVCDGKNFAFDEFKSPQDVTTLRDLASDAGSWTNPWHARHQVRVSAFEKTYNCVFVDAAGQPSLGARYVKPERKHRHRRD